MHEVDERRAGDDPGHGDCAAPVCHRMLQQDEAHNVTMLLIDADDDVEVSLVSSRARSKAAASDKLYAAAAWTSCPARSASRASALRAQQLRPPST
eukprot:jgi/Tetstr1/437717/TSEL_026371.t1